MHDLTSIKARTLKCVLQDKGFAEVGPARLVVCTAMPADTSKNEVVLCLEGAVLFVLDTIIAYWGSNIERIYGTFVLGKF